MKNAKYQRRRLVLPLPTSHIQEALDKFPTLVTHFPCPEHAFSSPPGQRSSHFSPAQLGLHSHVELLVHFPWPLQGFAVPPCTCVTIQATRLHQRTKWTVQQTYRALGHAILAAVSVVALALAFAVAHASPSARHAQDIRAPVFTRLPPVQRIALTGGKIRVVLGVPLDLSHTLAMHVAREDIAPWTLDRAVITAPAAETRARAVFLTDAAFRAWPGSSANALDRAVSPAEAGKAFTFCTVRTVLHAGALACAHRSKCLRTLCCAIESWRWGMLGQKGPGVTALTPAAAPHAVSHTPCQPKSHAHVAELYRHSPWPLHGLECP